MGWGLWRERWGTDTRPQAAPLRVLCAENWLSEPRLRQFSESTGIPIQLFTYARPGEFLRQMANADGKVDVVCTSSLLLRALVRSHWLRRSDFLSLGNSRAVAVDFLHLPFDPGSEYGLPLFWDLHGLVGRTDHLDTGWKATIQGDKVAVWGGELSLLELLSRWGLNLNLDHEESHSLQDSVHAFSKAVAQILPPGKASVETTGDLLGKRDWVALPLSRAARFLADGGAYHFALPADGAAMELGLLAIGAKSLQPNAALRLINDLLSTAHAEEVHERIGAGVVHRTLENSERISPWLRPQALRRFPLNRLAFPDLELETIPRFEKIYDQLVPSQGQ
jgi:spermidine/putrescine transport system substrate-binding protein